MKLGIALALAIAFPTMAAAQSSFQLRPSPYRILSGWEQNADNRSQTLEHDTDTVTPVSDRALSRQGGMRPSGHDSDTTGGIQDTRAPH